MSSRKEHRVVWLSLLVLIFAVFFMPVKPAFSQTTTIFIDPAHVIDDAKQAASTFIVDILISDVEDLYSWQVTLTWDASMLEITSDTDVTYGDFMGISGWFPFLRIENALGWASVGQSLAGFVPGISGSGWLFSVEFTVKDYGSTDLTYIMSGAHGSFLLDSALFDISFVTEDGYFSNKLLGDADGDGDCDFTDFMTLAAAYGTSVGDLNYDVDADFDHDGDVDFTDFMTLAAAYGTSI